MRRGRKVLGWVEILNRVVMESLMEKMRINPRLDRDEGIRQAVI